MSSRPTYGISSHHQEGTHSHADRRYRARLVYRLSLGAMLISFLTPGSHLLVFDGLPLTSSVEILLLLVVATVFGGLKLDVSQLSRRGLSGKLLISLCAATFVFIPIKFTSFLTSTDAGRYRVCFWSSLERPNSKGCEAEYANFGSSKISRYDQSIDFHELSEVSTGTIDNSNWNLAFVNDLRFNRLPTSEEASDPKRFPFLARWTGNIGSIDSSRELRISYVGTGALRIDNMTVNLPASYEEIKVVESLLPPGDGFFNLDYSFVPLEADPRSDNLDPYATLKVEWRDGSTSDWELLEPLDASSLEKALLRVLDFAQIGIMTLLALPLFSGNLRRLVNRTSILTFVAMGGWFISTQLGGISLPLWLFGALAGGLTSLALRSSPLEFRFFSSLLSASSALVVAQHLFPSWEYVDFKIRGDDWLTYEHFAREILITHSLRGGEDVFYYQPGFRYVLFAIHLVFGDGARGVVLVLTLFLAGSMFFLLIRLKRNFFPDLPQKIWLVSSIFAFAWMLLVHSPSVLRLLSWHASEIPAWALLILTFGLLLSEPSTKRLLLISILLGLVFVIRPNHLFTCVLIILVAIGLNSPRHRLKALTTAGVGPFLGVSALPVLHNLYYGRMFRILPTGSETVRDLSVGELLSYPWVEPARSLLLEKISRFFNPTMLTGAQGEITARLFILVWPLVIFSGLWIFGTRQVSNSSSPWVIKGFLLIPMGYLPTMILYDVDTYYPRHVIAFVLSIGLSGLAAHVIGATTSSQP